MHDDQKLEAADTLADFENWPVGNKPRVRSTYSAYFLPLQGLTK